MKTRYEAMMQNMLCISSTLIERDQLNSSLLSDEDRDSFISELIWIAVHEDNVNYKYSKLLSNGFKGFNNFTDLEIIKALIEIIPNSISDAEFDEYSNDLYQAIESVVKGIANEFADQELEKHLLSTQRE